jgi:fanconi anemia group M protein
LLGDDGGLPIGKVIFLAPTKPLVLQQIAACHDVMGIPEEDIAHLEGSVPAAKRSALWQLKRVFFCTPQTLMNDLQLDRCFAKMVVCIVFDEAHRASGNYAYCTVMQELSLQSNNFRVLALSATPGSDARKVQSVSTCLFFD